MNRILNGTMVVVIAFAALIVTGVINDQMLLLFIGFFGTTPEVAGETLRQATEAWHRSDWIAFAKIGTPFLRGFLLMYAVKSLLYGLSLAIVFAWTWPRVVNALDALRLGGRREGSTGVPADRESLIAAIRNRAEQRRVEAYAAMGTALVCLVIAIGFVTRDAGNDRPDSLDYNATSIDNTLDKSASALSDSRLSFDTRLDSYRLQQQQVLDLAANQLAEPVVTSGKNATTERAALIQAILAQASAAPSLQSGIEPEIARAYLDVARSQVELVKQQAKVEVIQRTILVAVAKLAAVALIFALSQILFRMYQRALGLAVQYDVIADALGMLGDGDSNQLARLREAMAPVGPQDKDIKIPKTVLAAMQSLVEKKGEPAG